MNTWHGQTFAFAVNCHGVVISIEKRVLQRVDDVAWIQIYLRAHAPRQGISNHM